MDQWRDSDWIRSTERERERDLVSTRNDVACVVHPIERFLVWPWQGGVDEREYLVCVCVYVGAS